MANTRTRTRARKKVASSPAGPQGTYGQPVDGVRWVSRDTLVANDYNPNHVAPVEMALLRLSILEDGWTQPIVVREIGKDRYEIVDGFHRWTISGDPDVAGMTDGEVPVVLLRRASRDHQRMSTIRHNRARGTHAVVKMADIVRTLHDDDGLSFEEIERRLGMEAEEVERLYDNADMRARGGAEDFGRGWEPGEAG